MGSAASCDSPDAIESSEGDDEIHDNGAHGVDDGIGGSGRNGSRCGEPGAVAPRVEMGGAVGMFNFFHWSEVQA